jgi:hypothetical protein
VHEASHDADEGAAAKQDDHENVERAHLRRVASEVFEPLREASADASQSA